MGDGQRKLGGWVGGWEVTLVVDILLLTILASRKLNAKSTCCSCIFHFLVGLIDRHVL